MARVRVYESIRTAHLERFRTMTPALTLYCRQRYDFDPSLARSAGIRRLGRGATVLHLLRNHYDAVELNEPLMTGRWLDLAAQILAVRTRSLLTRRPSTVGAYCISLTDPVEHLVQRWHVPARLARMWSRVALGVLVRAFDRLAFGTDLSRSLLATYVGEATLAPRSRTFPAVSARCDCGTDTRDAGTVLFLGAFTQRKGIRELLAGWDALPGRTDLRLRLIGTGPLLAEVEAWVSGRDDVELLVDPPRAEIHRALRTAHVLVLLSQRVGSWREQVGLPIVEGLAHGCEIVTTEETGLVTWLRDHGHTVVPTQARSEQVADALVLASASTRSSSAICADLPTQDPRAAADRWLLDPDAVRSRPR